VRRSVLIVTPFFAPQTHAAVFRAYKLAKLLPRFGWKPYVLTVDRNYLYNEDPSLLEDLPPEVEIIAARHVEPTLRGLRMAFGGEDRTFARLKARGLIRATAAGPIAPERPGFVRKSYEEIVGRWLQVPDAHRTWYGPAVRAARRLIRDHRIPLVFTTAPPFTCHQIGLTLHREGCPWVADIRDPITYCHNNFSRHPAVFAQQRRLERDAVSSAEAVTVASSAIGMILADFYGTEAASRIHFIPTGLDEDLIPADGSTRPRSYPYLVFAGEFLADYGSEFLETFAAALARPEVSAVGPKLLVVGRLEINRPQMLPHLRRLGIEDHVEFIDHVPQRELYGLLQAAEAGVLITSCRFRWWCLYAKMVDYIALRKPVVAVLPDPSEARTRLTRAGLGVFLDGDRRIRAAKLADFLLKRSERIRPDPAECNRYLASRQVESFVELFETLVSPRAPSPRQLPLPCLDSAVFSGFRQLSDSHFQEWTSKLWE
jgi:glycosyltransferase involved in cell wall biosynthesis